MAYLQTIKEYEAVRQVAMKFVKSWLKAIADVRFKRNFAYLCAISNM